jgi:5'-nucleotidase
VSVVLIDMDGVIVDWTARFERDLAHYYPHLKFEELKEFTTPKHLSQGHQNAIDFVKFRPGFYREMVPIAGAIDAIHRISDENEVFFCSTPERYNSTCADDKIWWLESYVGEGWSRQLILTQDKTAVRGDILIDDRPDIVGVFEPSWEHILFTQPYNADIVDDRQRLNSWAELGLLPSLVSA